MSSTPASDPTAPAVPPPLTVAASLAAVEAFVLVIEGVSLVPAMRGERLLMATTSAAFFLVYGGFLGYCAWSLYRRRSWARAPVILAQLIQALVGASFWGGATTIVAVLMIVAALIVIAGIMHPASLAALEEGDAARKGND